MKDWVEIGVYGPAEAGKNLGKQLYLQKHLINSGNHRIVITLEDRPDKVGVDPRNLLVDWNVIDNYKQVKTNN